LYTPPFYPHTLHGKLISFFSNLSSENYWVRNTDLLTCTWPFGVQFERRLCTGRPPTECDDTRCCI